MTANFAGVEVEGALARGGQTWNLPHVPWNPPPRRVGVEKEGGGLSGRMSADIPKLPETIVAGVCVCVSVCVCVGVSVSVCVWVWVCVACGCG